MHLPTPWRPGVILLSLCLLAACAGPGADYDADDNYVSADDTPVIVRGPNGVVAGTSFEVNWAGPGDPDDRIQVIAGDDSRTTELASTELSADSTVTLVAPEEAGLYRLVYVNGGGEILASQPLTVSQPQ